MQSSRLLKIQSERGATIIGAKDVTQKSIELVISECRRFIQDNSANYRDLSPDQKRAKIKELIISYVMGNPVQVEGYMDDNNNTDTNRLIDKLNEEITDYGILTAAMLDENIYEIRCNGREIKVEKNGRVVDLTDNKTDEVISFETPEQQDIIMRKLLGDERLTPKNSLPNSRTLEGFRIAAIHSSAISPDPDNPNGDGFHGFVLRKFKKSKMRLPDIVKFGTMSDNIARALNITAAGGLTWVTVGPTASGKTTTNNAMLMAIRPDVRVVLIQNPSEIDLRFKDNSGRVFNDVIHLEARDIENPSPTDPTFENLMIHTFRLSPTFVCFGELRRNSEFKLGVQLMQGGHGMNCTYHSESAHGGIMRYLIAYMSELGNIPAELALWTLTDLINIVLVQKIMPDGARKVIQLSEVLGVNKDNPCVPQINDLYVYELEDRVDKDEKGRVIKQYGRHKRVGKLSEKTIEKLKLQGIVSSQIDFLTRDVDEYEVETYTGENIENYGL